MPRVLPFRGDVQKTNFGYVFFGAGLLLAAPLLEHLRAGVNFRRGMLFFALLAILASAAAILAPREQVPAPR